MSEYDDMDDSAGYADSLTDVGIFALAFLILMALAAFGWVLVP